MKLHFEPFWWSLFGAGGVVAALFFPVLAAIIGLAIPLGWIEAPAYEHIIKWVEPVISRVVLFFIVVLPLFHWAHRFKFTLIDGLQLQNWSRLLGNLCYGLATLLTLVTGYILLNF